MFIMFPNAMYGEWEGSIYKGNWGASAAEKSKMRKDHLERWDHHSTNNYGLVPYTGLRQPLVKPLGESRSIQLILRDLDQFSYQEIAETLGIGLSAAKMRIKRARAEFRQRYQGDSRTGPAPE